MMFQTNLEKLFLKLKKSKAHIVCIISRLYYCKSKKICYNKDMYKMLYQTTIVFLLISALGLFMPSSADNMVTTYKKKVSGVSSAKSKVVSRKTVPCFGAGPNNVGMRFDIPEEHSLPYYSIPYDDYMSSIFDAISKYADEDLKHVSPCSPVVLKFDVYKYGRINNIKILLTSGNSARANNAVALLKRIDVSKSTPFPTSIEPLKARIIFGNWECKDQAVKARRVRALWDI